jgi:hypothetical protein
MRIIFGIGFGRLMVLFKNSVKIIKIFRAGEGVILMYELPYLSGAFLGKET